MNWYYSDGNKEVGPLTEATMAELRACGMLSADTLVCREGSETWMAYDEVFEKTNTSQTPDKTGAPESLIKFNCPHCDQHIAAERSDAGAGTQCPSCGGEIVVPATSNEMVEDSAEVPAAPTAPGDANSNPEPTLGAEDEHSFAARLKEGVKEGWGGIKRHSKQVALIAQIEKLRNVDLRKAYHDLGKKCFESAILEDALPEQFQAIRDLDTSIAEKREKAEAESQETKTAALKRKGMDAAHAIHAQALAVKREHLITELGRQAYAANTEVSPEGLQDDFTAITDIEERIHHKEEEMRELGDGKKSRMPTSAAAAVLGMLLVAVAFVSLKAISSRRDNKDYYRLGDTQAQYDLGDSMEELRKGAEQGHAEAQSLLGTRYFNGDGVEQDRAEAVKWYRKAAEQGDAEAQLTLGLCYAHSEGVTKNESEAVKWYRKAAEQGDSKAQCILGNCYSNGEGVVKNEADAVKWWRKSAEQGDAAAQANLGSCYGIGKGVERDYVEAYKWSLLAAAQGHEDAKMVCELIQKKLSPDQHAEGQRVAKKWTAAHEKTRQETQKRRDVLKKEMSSEEARKAQELSRDWKPTPKDKSPSEQGTPSIPNLDEAIAIIADIYPELTRSEQIRMLEDISGLKMNSSANVRRAIQMVENLKSAAQMSGQSERKFFDLSERLSGMKK